MNHILGWEGPVAWWRGADVPPTPNGQQSSPAADGRMRTDGPLGYTRHPVNWFLLPLFWLHPRMTTRLLAFNAVTTVAVVLGSLHADARATAAYGPAYRDYQIQVPFLLAPL